MPGGTSAAGIPPWPSDREIVITHVFDAPRRIVFKMWTSPKHVAQWWGPRGFTNPVCEWEAQPGGAIYVVMRGPNGVDYPMSGAFREVVEPERLVFTSGALGKEGKPLFELLHTVTFAESARRTTLTVRSRVVRSTAEAARYLAGYEAGMTQSLERLDAHVRTARKGGSPVTKRKANPADDEAGREIVITRVFDAPRELVWAAWTDPQQVVRWWGPRGFTTTIEVMDVRLGGVWKHVMHGPDGTDYPNKSVFKEVVKPERIVYAHGGGKQGGPGVHFEATWTFEALGDRTRVTMRSLFSTAAERDVVVKEYGAIEGGKQTLERLAEHMSATSSAAG